MLRIVVVALVVLVATMFLLPRGERGVPPASATLLPEPRVLADVALIDETGNATRLGALGGNFTLLFFGFTNCPDVCPTTLAMLAAARAEIVRRAPRLVPRVVFVSVDPNRDTPARIAAYLDGFEPEFAGVTGTEESLTPLLDALGVAVERHKHGGADYNVVHNSAIYFLDPNARWIAVSTGPHDPVVLAADYLKIRQRYQGGLAPDA
jgi:protein SCO1/2